MSCTASCCSGWRQSSNVGAKNAPSPTPSPTGEKPSLAPYTCSALCSSTATRSDTSAHCACDASAPMRTSSRDGSPATTFDSRARSPAATASMCWRGTMARRMAVHFWPALVVISRATSLMKSSNSSSPGETSGARMAQLSESASALKGTEWRIRLGCTRNLAAVSAEPVKVTTSEPCRRSSRSPVPPTTSCRLPSGSRPEPIIRRTAASVR